MDAAEKIQNTLESYWETIVVSVPKIAISALIIALFTFLAMIITRFIRRRVNPRAESPLVAAFITKLVRFTIILVGIILALHAAGLQGLAGGLLAGAGVGAVVLGFAFKEIGENFIAGILLVFDRPFRMGDTITVNDNQGIVKALNFRTTLLKTFDGKDVYIPNSDIITNTVYNHTQDGYLRQEFIIGIDYDDDIDVAISEITKVVNDHPEILQDEKTQVLIDEFGTNTVNLEVRFWTKTMDYKVAAAQIKTEVMRDTKNLLLKKKFGLPANIQEVKLYKDSPLTIKIDKEDLQDLTQK